MRIQLHFEIAIFTDQRHGAQMKRNAHKLNIATSLYVRGVKIML